MTHSQHKTRLVTGGLSGSNNVKKDTDIVNHFTENTTSFSKAVSVLGNRGYNATSLKNWQHPATVSRFIYTPNQGKRVSTYTHIRTPLGVWAIGNDPADQFGESTPAFIGGLSISKTGGQHG